MDQTQVVLDGAVIFADPAAEPARVTRAGREVVVHDPVLADRTLLPAACAGRDDRVLDGEDEPAAVDIEYRMGSGGALADQALSETSGGSKYPPVTVKKRGRARSKAGWNVKGGSDERMGSWSRN